MVENDAIKIITGDMMPIIFICCSCSGVVATDIVIAIETLNCK